MRSQIDVFNIIGMSYSGSTIFNYMMDCHPEVYGGGELHWLFRQHNKNAGYHAHCTTCNDDCPIWKPEIRTQAPKQNFYGWLSNLTGAKVIVDTSKHWSWFKKQKENAEDNVNFYDFLLVKHPIRHLASFMSTAQKRPEMSDFHHIDTATEFLVSYYQKVLSQTKETELHIIHYENLVRDTDNCIQELLDLVGLTADPTAKDCFSKVHHQIGGNAGPIYQVTKTWPSARNNHHPLRVKQYEQESGIFLDNKYQDFFTEEEIVKILEHPGVQALEKQLRFKL